MTTSIEIAPASYEHLSLLSEFWYDAAVLRQQMNPRISVSSYSRGSWEDMAKAWIDTDVCFRVIFLRSELVGCIQADIVYDNEPIAYGRINAFIVDMHTQQAVHGLGKALLDTAETWFIDQNISHVTLNVPIITPVEQAFWQSVGVIKKDDDFWLTIG